MSSFVQPCTVQLHFIRYIYIYSEQSLQPTHTIHVQLVCVCAYVCVCVSVFAPQTTYLKTTLITIPHYRYVKDDVKLVRKDN